MDQVKVWLLLVAYLIVWSCHSNLAKITLEQTPSFTGDLAIVISECLKLIFCTVALTRRSQKTSVRRRTPFLLYNIPAVCYLAYNKLSYLCLTYLDPAAFRVAQNGKIISVSVLSYFLLQQKFSLKKVFALVLLLAGCLIAQINTLFTHPTESTFNGLFLVVVQILFASFATVYNEKLLKSLDASLHTQNFWMYSWSLVLGVLYLGYVKLSDPSKAIFASLSSTPAQVGCLAVLAATGGLVGSVILKNLSSTTKVFVGSVEVVLTALTSKYFLGKETSPSLFLGVAVSFVALFLFSKTRPA